MIPRNTAIISFASLYIWNVILVTSVAADNLAPNGARQSLVATAYYNTSYFFFIARQILIWYTSVLNKKGLSREITIYPNT